METGRHWGEIPADPLGLADNPDDQRSARRLLMQSAMENLVLPSQFKLNPSVEQNPDPRFHANPDFVTSNCSNSLVSGKQNNYSLDGPFFETVKMIVGDGGQQSRPARQPTPGPPTTTTRKDFVAEQMRQSVILMLTHAGFDDASHLTVDLLVDILDYYLRSFGKLMRTFTDSQRLQSPNDFYDIVDKVMHHMKIPNIEALRRFHQDLVQYHQQVQSLQK